MRVIHVVRQFYPAIGGLENFVLDLAKAQKSQGIEASVITLDRRYDTNETLAAESIEGGVEVKRINYIGSKKYPIAPSVLPLIKEADIVHIHAVDFFVDFLALTKFLHKKPIVLSTHGGFFHTKYAQRLKKIYFNTVTRASLIAANKIVSCSVNDQNLFSRLYPRKTQLIENGVNTTKFYSGNPTHSNRQLLFIGRFSDNKRIDLLIHWFSKLVQSDDQFRLVIAGQDWDNNLSQLTRQISRLQLDKYVEFVLEASEEELKKIVSESSFVVSASEYEGFGMTIIECMAGGLIPLMSDIQSFRQIHTSCECGWIIDFCQPDSATKWLNTLNQQQNIPALKNKAITAAQRYSWSKVSLQFNQVYKTVITTKPSHEQTTI